MRKWAGVLLVAITLAFAVTAGATVTGTSSRVEYTGNGSTKVFTFTFSTKASTHIKIYLGGTLASTGYSVVLNADQTVNPGGSVTFTTAPGSSVVVRIQREEPLTAETVYPTYGQYQSKVIERDADSRVRQLQQVDRRVADQEVKQAADDAARQAAEAALSVTDSTNLATLSATDSTNLATTLNAVAALNGTSHSVTSLSSVLAYGSTTPRTLTARFADVLNVKDFGAVGDGVTDDRVNIQRALDAVPVQGGAVYFPPSPACYYVTGSIRPKSNTSMLGDGYGSCIVMPAAGWDKTSEPGTQNYGIITIDDVSNVSVTGLRIRGSKTLTSLCGTYQYAPGLMQISSDTASVTNVLIENNTFENSNAIGIWMAGPFDHNQDIRIIGNHFYDIAYTATGCAQPAVQTNANGVTVSGNTFDRVEAAIGASGMNLSITGNFIRDSLGYAISTGDQELIRNISITGNVIEATVVGSEHANYHTTAIVLSPSHPGQPLDQGTVVTGNSVHYIVQSSNFLSIGGISSVDMDSVVSSNDISYDFQTNYIPTGSNPIIAFEFSVNDNSARIDATGNAARFYSINSSTYDGSGIQGFRTLFNGAVTLTLTSRGNHVTGTTTGQAFGYAASGGGRLILWCDRDVTEGGYFLAGDYVTYANTPVTKFYDSASSPTYLPVVYLSGLEVARYIEGSAFSNAGMVRLRGHSTPGAGSPALEVDSATALTGNDPLASFKNGTAGTPLEIHNSGRLRYPNACDTSGTPGNATCDQPVGKSAIAASASTVTITNSLVGTNSLIIATLTTNDATAILKNVVPASGSFTVNLTATATGNTTFAWQVIQRN